MANLKDLNVTGSSRLIGTLYGNNIEAGGDITGTNVEAKEYLCINAWTGYGTGKAKFWYNGAGSNRALHLEGTTKLIISDKEVAFKDDIQDTDYLPRSELYYQVSENKNSHTLNTIKGNEFDIKLYGNTEKIDNELITNGTKLNCDRCIDLGSLTWVDQGAENRVYSQQIFSDMSDNVRSTFIYCDGFETKYQQETYERWDNAIYSSASKVIYIHYPNGTDARTFINSLSGKKAYYQSTSYSTKVNDDYTKYDVKGKNMMPIMTTSNIKEVFNSSGKSRWGYLFYANEDCIASVNKTDVTVSTGVYLTKVDINTLTIINNYSLVSQDGTITTRSASKGNWWCVMYGASEQDVAITTLNSLNIQLEYGNTNTSYEQYHLYGSQIINTPLNSVGDVYDTLEINAEIECDKCIDLGDYTWTIVDFNGSNVFRCDQQFTDHNVADEDSVIEGYCSKYRILSRNDVYRKSSTDLIMAVNSIGRMIIRDFNGTIENLKGIKFWYKSTAYNGEKTKVVKLTRNFKEIDLTAQTYTTYSTRKATSTINDIYIESDSEKVPNLLATNYTVRKRTGFTSLSATGEYIGVSSDGKIVINTTGDIEGKAIYQLATPQVYCFDSLELTTLSNDTICTNELSDLVYHNLPTTATVTEDATHRFVTDEEKALWNAKADISEMCNIYTGTTTPDDSIGNDGDIYFVITG